MQALIAVFYFSLFLLVLFPEKQNVNPIAIFKYACERKLIPQQSSVCAAENKIRLTKVLLIYREQFVTDCLGRKQRKNLL